jgi:uncharacterized membrane protein YcgQ (UPF0703/DUF1980 family)
MKEMKEIKIIKELLKELKKVKKNVLIMLMLAVLANILSSCQAAPKVEIVKIKEKMFITQINDIYANPEDYLGKTIKYEGIFKIDELFEKEYYSVIRYGPGCCGPDSNVGFLLKLGNERPNSGDWVEVVGVLIRHVISGYRQLCIEVTSLKALPIRGEETVLR